MDPSIFVAYTPQANGVPVESKLATYMSRPAPALQMHAANIAKDLSNLSLDPKKVINAEYIPGRSMTQHINNSCQNAHNNSFHSHENVSGTTYFYPVNGIPHPPITVEEGVEIPPSVDAPPLAYVYPGTPSYLLPLQPSNTKSGKGSSTSENSPSPQCSSFFINDTLREDLLQKNSLTLAQTNLAVYPDLPANIENYHDLVPLEPINKSGYNSKSSMFKATNIKNGTRYCLRRIHDFKLASNKSLVLVDSWKKLGHTNLVQLRDVFTTQAFNDHSIIFVYDYHPGSETLLSKHFSSPDANGQLDPFSSDPNAPRPYSHTKNTIMRHQHNNMLPESIIWSYIIQLTAALRVIHAAGLAYRFLDPTKVILTSRTRLRLSCLAVPDVLSYDSSTNPVTLVTHYQQEDLVALGKLVLALACRSLLAVHRDNVQTALDVVSRVYSGDLRNLILYLLSNSSRKSVTDLMPMIGARFYTQLDAAQLCSDVYENELMKELENGRLFRLIVKLATINERPEVNMDPQWSETGDRYMLKLFRDYVFHQVTEDGRPWLDLAHVVSCLNKLDGNSTDKICLMSRDEQSVLVVSYEELRHCMEVAFGELAQAAKDTTAEAV